MRVIYLLKGKYYFCLKTVNKVSPRKESFVKDMDFLNKDLAFYIMQFITTFSAHACILEKKVVRIRVVRNCTTMRRDQNCINSMIHAWDSMCVVETARAGQICASVW